MKGGGMPAGLSSVMAPSGSASSLPCCNFLIFSIRSVVGFGFPLALGVAFTTEVPFMALLVVAVFMAAFTMLYG